MKIEKLDQGVYHLSETTSTHSLTLTASELVAIYDWVLLHMAELQAEAKEEQEEE